MYTEGCGITLARSIRLEAAPGSHVRLDCKGQERHFVIDAGIQIEVHVLGGRAGGRGGGIRPVAANAEHNQTLSSFSRALGW